MKRYTQDIFHDPENGKLGNCFATCLRCILEIEEPIENFVEHDDWFFRVQHFLHQYDLAYLTSDYPVNPALWDFFGYHILSGDGGRGTNGEVIRHAVVGYKGKIVWDPHPSRDGLVDDPRDWGVGYLVFRGEKGLTLST